MRPSTRPLVAALSLATGLALVPGMVACGGSATPTPVAPHVPTITTLPSLDEMLSEKILGSTSAPNVIIMYVSFYRSTSRDFYLTGDGAAMRTQLAAAGRAQILFRNLFVGGETSQSGVPVAAALARCVGNAHFFDAVNTIFQTQSSWGAASNPDLAVEQVMLGFGMSQSLEDSCLANTGLTTGLFNIHNAAEQATYTMPDGTQRVGSASAGVIYQVPAVVVNGVLFDGMADASTVSAAFAPTMANITPFLK